MKKLLNHNLILGLTICIIVSITIFTLYKYSKIYSQSEFDSFTNFLSSYEIILEGGDTNLTQFQLEGLIEMLNTKNTKVIEKYRNKISKTENNITLTTEEIFELDYYSKTKEEQKAYLNKLKGKKVSISSKNGSILISYNVDEKKE